MPSCPYGPICSSGRLATTCNGGVVRRRCLQTDTPREASVDPLLAAAASPNSTSTLTVFSPRLGGGGAFASTQWRRTPASSTATASAGALSSGPVRRPRRPARPARTSAVVSHGRGPSNAPGAAAREAEDGRLRRGGRHGWVRERGGDTKKGGLPAEKPKLATFRGKAISPSSITIGDFAPLIDQ